MHWSCRWAGWCGHKQRHAVDGARRPSWVFGAGPQELMWVETSHLLFQISMIPILVDQIFLKSLVRLAAIWIRHGLQFRTSIVCWLFCPKLWCEVRYSFNYLAVCFSRVERLICCAGIGRTKNIWVCGPYLRMCTHYKNSMYFSKSKNCNPSFVFCTIILM